MFKPTKALQARLKTRLRLTTKQVNGGYYKGNRTGSMGFFAPNGRYVLDYRKVRTYVVPEGLADFKLTPFVTRRMEPTKSSYTKEIEVKGQTKTVVRAPNGKDFLKQWAEENSEEPAILKAQEKQQARQAARGLQ